MSLEVSFSHSFPGFTLEIDFVAPTPGVTVLFGPSGAGKSSVVGAVAGLLRPRVGRVAVDGEVLADSARGLFLPPERRRIGLVFQDARLFPHMTVARNLRYGQRRAAPGPIRFDDVVALLGIGHLLDRRPRALSGGERQRVAIGRALLSQPRLLVMDEPLASLDAARKAEILPYLVRLQRALSLPILYVTHAAEEVLRLADTLVLLEAGHVAAAGPLSDIAARASLPFAARDDAAGVLTARVAGHVQERQLTQLDAGGQSVWVPLLDLLEGAVVRVQVPAREVVLATEAPRAVSVHNVLHATVRDVILDVPRHAALVELGIGAEALLARVTPDAVERLALAQGTQVLALFKSMSVVVMPR